ncbi:MAG: peptide chain release factor N(5)-glutamine methyltransferase [Gammaproteobacteria bacterium]|jgi:release factor glutamine methyltransferase|nr:peptide chain release factor N(5)-glutamine methyltransferase [Gammaproteobacteria bacterium]MDP6166641.1 peptide chain release factor N(5)-glutamine methyltransferase [Gammaproteobacteria bacterium]
MIPTREQALAWARKQLMAGESPVIDCEIMLTHVLGCSSASLYAWPEKPLPEEAWPEFQQAVERRSKGEPVAYIVGTQGFWNLTLQTDSSTLIPRPETELLVELVLSKSWPKECQLLDLGTGTGAIALALAGEHPSWQVLGVEYNCDAVSLAQTNARLNCIHNARFEQGNWALAVAPGWHCIVSNPPYIDSQDAHLQQGDVRFEPLSALVAADAGLADIKLIAEQAMERLLPEGWLFLEHGCDQGQAVREILLAWGFNQVQTELDYGQRERITLGQKAASKSD